MSSPPTTPQVHAIGLGHAEIRVGDAVITPASDRLFALAFQLCLRAGEYIPRDELIALFWGDAAPTKGRHSLRQMLYRLRQMGLPLFDAGDAVHLPEAVVHCDVREVLRDGWELDAPAAMVRAGGERIAGGAMDHSEAYREWYDAMEARVRSQLRRAALRHLSAARREGRWRDLEEWALHVLRHDALNEEATLGLAESMVMQGSKARALELLDGYLRELGEKADRVGLPARVLRKRIVGVGDERKNVQQATPLIGREEAVETLTAFLSSKTAASPRSLLIQGPAGVGKTRLADEAGHIASLGGYSVVTVAPLSAASTAASISALGIELSRLVESLPGAAAADPLAMSTVRQMIHGRATPPSPLHTPQDSDATHSSHALASVLASAAYEAAVCVIVEDTHNLIAPDIRLLNHLLALTKGSRVFWVITSRPDDSLQTRHGVSAQVVMRVGRLSAKASRALADSFCVAQCLTWPDEDLTALSALSGGNPLLLQTLLLQPQSEPIRASSADLERALNAYLETMPISALRILDATALLQPFANVSRVVSACGLSPIAALQHLGPLVESGILRDTPSALAVHDTWAETLRARKTPAEAAALSLLCANALKADVSTLSHSQALAHAAALFREGGDHSSARNCLCLAAELLSQRGDHKGAYTLLIEAQSGSPEGEAARILLPRLTVSAYLTSELAAAERFGMRFVAASAPAPAAATDDTLYCLAIAADSQWKLNKQFAPHLDQLVRSLGIGQGSTAAYATACLFALRLAFAASDDGLARRIHTLQLDHSAQNGDTLISSLVSIIYFAEIGDATQLNEALSRSSVQQATPQPEHILCLALRYRTTALRYLGRTFEAVSLALEGRALAEKAGMPSEGFQFAISAAFTLLDEGSDNEAEDWLFNAAHLKDFLGSPERERAFEYGRARLQFLRGEYDAVLEHYDTLRDVWQSDNMPRRKALEMALAAAALARVGRLAESSDLAISASAIITETAPTQQLDAAVEQLLETYSIILMPDNAARLAAAYLHARDSNGRRYIPASFTRLRNVAGTFYAAAETPVLRSTLP